AAVRERHLVQLERQREAREECAFVLAELLAVPGICLRRSAIERLRADGAYRGQVVVARDGLKRKAAQARQALDRLGAVADEVPQRPHGVEGVLVLGML